jgi:CheY-like chemotaxis protein
MVFDEKRLTMKKHVLLVENEPSHQELIRDALELGGYSVTIAQNGLEGFDMLTTATPCVIVLDLWMPEMSGYAFLEMLHQRNIDASIPIIVITADAQAEVTLAHEHLTILVKPFHMSDLTDALAKYCP